MHRSRLAIDLGDFSTKLCFQNNDSYQFWSYANLSDRQKCDSRISSDEYWCQVASFLSEKLQPSELLSSQLFYVLQGEGVYCQYLEFEHSLSEGNWSRSLEQAARADLPIGGKQWVLTWLVVPSLERHFQEAVFYVAIEAERIREVYEQCLRYNLPLGSVHSSALSLAGSCSQVATSTEDWTIVIDCGYESSRVMVFRAGFPYFFRSFELGMMRFLQEYELQLEGAFSKAQEAILSRQLEDSFGVSSRLKEWKLELEKSWKECIHKLNLEWDSQPSKVFLTGGGSNWEALQESCKELFSKDITLLTPPSEILDLAKEPVDNATLWSSTFGVLALEPASDEEDIEDKQ